MTDTLKKLVMTGPRDLEETLVQVLLEFEAPLPAFTTVHAFGHGDDLEQASLRERVRGKVDQLVVSMVLPEADVQRVLDRVGQQLTHSRISWWLEPVDAMGQLP